LQGLARDLNGTELPDEVYEACDLAHVLAEFDRLITRTASAARLARRRLHCYGPSFAAMQAVIAPRLSAPPIRHARIAASNRSREMAAMRPTFLLIDR
jgi:hypothetical protein